MSLDEPTAPSERHSVSNRFDRMEWAGAFGDLGTLVPFVVAYIAVLKVDPFGVLFAFGVSSIVCGLYYKTPFPVQPMKAIGAVATTQAAQTAVITTGAVYAASFVTGLIWLLLGLTGLTKRVADIISRPVAIGIVLGLGIGFMIDGSKLMAAGWVLSVGLLLLTLLLLSNRVIPAMFLLLIAGAAVAIVRDPQLLTALEAIKVEARLPTFALSDIHWSDVVIGVVFLALPQVPLTLGNAIIAITEENNRLFPNRPITERGVSV